MMQIISLFVLYELSLANRLLLQNIPVTIPTDQPNQNYVPAYIEPHSQIVIPGGVTIPTDVPNFTPPNVDPIVIPAVVDPIVIPQSVLPAGPIQVARPDIPFVEIPSLTQPHSELVCAIPYPEPGSCAQLEHMIYNPVERFKLECSNFGSCAGANITLEYSPGTYVERIQYFLFTEMSSAYNAIITVDNRMPNRGIKIENIECTGAMACEDTTFVFKGLISVADFKCKTEEYCRGCQVKRDINDFVGIPCAYYQ